MARKLYILTESIGTGHSQAARAIAEMIQKTHPEDRVEVIDFLSSDILSIDQMLKHLYFAALKKAPNLYDLVYKDASGGTFGKFTQNFIETVLVRRMKRLVKVLQPDAMIFTHPFPAGAADIMRARGELSIPLINVVTDFDAHQFFVTNHMDALCVASTSLRDSFVKYGMDPHKFYITGIPVRQAFYEVSALPRSVEPGSVLLMGGGLGLGDIQDNLKRLDSVHEISKFIVITGQNISLYEKVAALSSRLHHEVELHSYTNKVAQIMGRSELLVTKPGALTCTEAMTVNLPMVLVNTLPGQERANAAFLADMGCARWVKRGELASSVHMILTHPEIRENMARACGDHHPESAKKVVDILYKLLQEKN